MSGITSKLAAYVCDLKFEDIPAPCVERIKYAILDTVGCIILGTSTEAGRAVCRYVEKSGTKLESKILGTNKKASCINAALVNGTMGHEFDYDDGVSPALGLHAGITIIPAALATAEKQKANGKEFITAVVAGYELSSRIGRAIEKTQHAPILIGTFGATAASAKLMGATLDQMINALGICSALSPLRPFEPALAGVMVKDIWAGWSNYFGAFCASLAVEGLTGPKDAIDPSKGFFKAAAQDENIDVQQLKKDLGTTYLWMDGHYFKPYPSCRGTHVTLDAVLKLVREHKIDPSEIKKIFVTGRPIVSKLKGLFNPISARFSTPYAVAAAVVDGQLTLDEFSKAKLQEPIIVELASKVETLVDPSIPEYPHAHGPVEVIIIFHDGTIISSRATEERSLNYDQVISKFQENASRTLNKEKVNLIVGLSKNLENLENIEVFTDAMST